MGARTSGPDQTQDLRSFDKMTSALGPHMQEVQERWFAVLASAMGQSKTTYVLFRRPVAKKQVQSFSLTGVTTSP